MSKSFSFLHCFAYSVDLWFQVSRWLLHAVLTATRLSCTSARKPDAVLAVKLAQQPFVAVSTIYGNRRFMETTTNDVNGPQWRKWWNPFDTWSQRVVGLTHDLSLLVRLLGRGIVGARVVMCRSAVSFSGRTSNA